MSKDEIMENKVLGIPAVAAGALVMLLGATLANAADYKPLPKGTVIEYDTWSCEVRKTTGFETKCRDDDDRSFSLYGLFEPVGRLNAETPFTHLSPVECKTFRSYGGWVAPVEGIDLGSKAEKAIKGLWPLAKGKKAKYELDYDINANFQEMKAQVKVTGRETVTVNGTAYDTFVLEQKIKRFCASNNSAGREVDAADYQRKLWIDAAHHVLVKEEFEWTSGTNRGDGHTYELVSLTLPSTAPAIAQAAPRPAIPRAATQAPAQSAVTVDVDKSGPLIEVPPTIQTGKAVVEISGHILDESRIIEVRIDGRAVPMEADGTLSVARGVPVGTTTFTLSALDEWGNASRHAVTVTRSSAAPQMAAAPKATPKPVAKVATDQAAPVIDLPDSLSTTRRTIELAGRISDSSKIVEVTVEGRPVAVSSDGSVTVKRAISVGANTIRIAAIDEWGNKAEKRISVERRRPFADINFGNYHAIVIGNNDYTDMPKLKSAENDATAVAEILKQDYGYTVDLMLNATRADIIKALADARAKLKANDNLLVYYAGHGILDTYAEEGYWLPVDAEKDNPANWVSNSDVTNMLRAIRAKHVMVVADSCYSGTLVRAVNAKIDTAKEREAWLKKMVKKRTRTALVSGGLEPVVDSGGGGHSVFAKAFLDALRNNEDVMEAERLFSKIKRPVALESDQTPQYSDVRRAGHDGGDFMFVRR